MSVQISHLVSGSDPVFKPETRNPAPPPLDREILVLRHYEQMTNDDDAAALGLDKSAAIKRYTRALQRLKEILAALPGESPEG